MKAILYRYPHPNLSNVWIYVGQSRAKKGRRHRSHCKGYDGFGRRFKNLFPNTLLPEPVIEEIEILDQLELNGLEIEWMFRFHTWHCEKWCHGMNLSIPGSHDYTDIAQHGREARKQWWESLSVDERSARAKHASDSLTKEQRSEIGKNRYTPEILAEYSAREKARMLAKPSEERIAQAIKASHAMSYEDRLELSRKNLTLMTSERAKERDAMMTPEERSERARRGQASISAERKSEIARKRWISKTPEERGCWIPTNPEDVIEAYKTQSVETIAQQNGVSSMAISNFLRRNGVQFRRIGRPSILCPLRLHLGNKHHRYIENKCRFCGVLNRFPK